MGSEEPIVSGSIDDSLNEGIINNNNDVNEGSDMDTSGEATPILGGKKSEPVVAPAPSAEPVANAPVAAAPKKKSHAGLIITIIILAVLLIGGGVAAFLWMTWHESPEVAINDAMSKAFEAESRTISGTFNMTSPTPVTIKLDGSQADGNFGGNGTITIAGLIDVKFEAAYIKGSDFYVKLDGIKNALKKLPISELFGGMMGGSASSSSSSAIISTIISSIGDVVDGEWIKIDSSAFGDLNSGNKCGASEISLLFDGNNTKDLAAAYKNNAFIVQKKDSEVKDEDGVKYYEVEINEEKNAAFKKAIEETEFGKTLKKCAASETNDEEKEKEDSSVIGKNAKIFIGVKPWSHELVALKIEPGAKDNQATADLKIGYEKKSIETPSNAKTYEEIKKKIEEALGGAMGGYNYGGNYGGGYSYNFDDYDF